MSGRALRHYEEQNLPASVCSPGGQRQYPDSAVDRVQLLQQLYAAGLSGGTITEPLPCVEPGDVPAELLNRLPAQRDRIDAQVSTLAQTATGRRHHHHGYQSHEHGPALPPLSSAPPRGVRQRRPPDTDGPSPFKSA